MLEKTPYIVDMFERIVADVNTNFDDANVRYEFGKLLEITQTVNALSKVQATAATSFPLIALLMDFEEEKGSRLGIESKVKLNLIIVARTKASYTAAERYKFTLKPILYPLYELLMSSIADSCYFAGISTENPPKHKKIDSPYYGKSGTYANTANIFNDFVDAVAVTDLELEVYKQHCRPTIYMSKS